jgi:hypothetical protein
VRDCAGDVGPVGEECAVVGMDKNVNMACTAAIVAGENGLKLGSAIVSRLLDATEEGRVLSVQMFSAEKK